MTKLGFHPPLTRLYVFVKNEGNALWYYLDDGQKRYIQDSALTGILKRYQDLLARTKQNGYSTAGFAQLIAKFGFSRGSEITQEAYPQLWSEGGDRNQASLMNARAK